MPPNSGNTFGYTGVLKANVSDGLGDGVAGKYLHIARVKLGAAIARADLADQTNVCEWFYFPDDDVTVRVGRFGELHIADITRPVARKPFGTETSGGFIWPLGGMLRDSYLEVVTAPVNGSEVSLKLNNSFIPTPESQASLDEAYNDMTKWLETETGKAPLEEVANVGLLQSNTHNKNTNFLRPTPYLALPVPKHFGHPYNNPVQPQPGSTVKPKVYAQHRLMKPTMYSGLMRVVAQLLMGFGIDGAPTDKMIADMQSKEFSPDEKVVESYQHGDPEAPESDNALGSMNYWFHWFKTHGVYKTEGGRYYLIQITQDGMHAMRLPVMPEENGLPDEAAEYLHAMPLGYGLPRKGLTEEEIAAGAATTPLDSAIEDGWVFEVLSKQDMADFYEKLSPTYLECGWAFSMSGKKIENVGWRVNAPRPYDYPVVEQWHIDLDGGDGPSPSTWDYQHKDGGYDESINTLRATIRKVGQGNALDIAQYGQAFKVPSVDDKTGVPCVTSFDMMPRGWPKVGNNIPPDYMKVYKSYPVSDTVVHVFYDDEELVTTRFYNPMNTSKQESDSWDDRDWTPYCMLLGSYTWGDYTKNTTKPKGFYTSRNDPRKTADESRTEMESQGSKTWTSPYMGIEYSWPYPPFHFGYEQSNSDGEWYNDFDPSYRSRVGSPWTAKRHCFHVHVHGTRVTGQSYSYSAAIPLTDRECIFICEKHVAATRSKVDYKYAAMVMQFVYNTYPSWVPDLELWDKGIIPVGYWPEWQMRDDTVKYLRWMFFDAEHNYTNEERQNPQTVLNIASGTHTAPVDTWDRSKPEVAVEDYKVFTECSSLGGKYPFEMKGVGGSDQLWEWTLPFPTFPATGYELAHLWCTRSVLGNEGYKQNIYLNGAMNYAGVFNTKLTVDEKTGRHKQITYVGVT